MKPLTLSIAILAALGSTTANAESWLVTQQVTLGSATTMTQNGTTSAGSVQAMNAFNAPSAAGQLNATTTLGTNTLILNQEGSTTSSTQAVNYSKSKTYGSDMGAPKKILSSTAAVTLNQTASGTNNTQTINDSNATTLYGEGQEIASTVTTVKMNQETTGANTQTINNAVATTKIDTLSQTAEVTSSFDLNQAGAGSQTQAVNRIMGGTTASDYLTQTVTGGSAATTMDQTSTGVSTQALNMSSSIGISNKATQSSTGALKMTQGASGAAVGNGSVQAGNYLRSTGVGVINNVDQDLGSGDNAISLIQTASSVGTVQAGNIIDLQSSESAAALTASTQDITTTGTLTLTQTATGYALQAGNAILTSNGGANTGGAGTQTIAVGTLAMTQTNGITSFQAANYVGIAPDLDI
jgi:hypothetical protein